MEVQQQIEADIKNAMLSGDKAKTETLKGLKTALQYETVSLNAKETGLSADQAQKVLAREAKKRTDAIQLYEKANEAARAALERAEKAIIDAYLPEQASDSDIQTAVDVEIAKLDNPTLADMGKIISAVRIRLGAGADGSTIAGLVKQKLEQS